MESILAGVVSLFVTALMLFGAMMIALLVGALSGAAIKRILGIGGKG